MKYSVDRGSLMFYTQLTLLLIRFLIYVYVYS